MWENLIFFYQEKTALVVLPVAEGDQTLFAGQIFTFSAGS